VRFYFQSVRLKINLCVFEKVCELYIVSLQSFLGTGL